eukprot:1987027-Amphidinium_carterae.1
MRLPSILNSMALKGHIACNVPCTTSAAPMLLSLSGMPESASDFEDAQKNKSNDDPHTSNFPKIPTTPNMDTS